jgi:hypothetical protein
MDAESHRAIEAVLIRYATAIDERDWDLLLACFTEDVEADYGTIGMWADRRSLVDHMARRHDRFGQTLHRISNVVIRGNTQSAQATCYIDALLMPIQAGNPIRRAFGRYDDVLVNDANGWIIGKRKFISVLITDRA